MADIDRDRFAHAIADALDAAGLSLRGAVAEWPDLNPAMLSRAINRQPLSAGNFLMLCRVFGLDPFRFLITEKRRRVTLRDIRKALADQTVTELAKRETEATRP